MEVFRYIEVTHNVQSSDPLRTNHELAKHVLVLLLVKTILSAKVVEQVDRLTLSRIYEANVFIFERCRMQNILSNFEFALAELQFFL